MINIQSFSSPCSNNTQHTSSNKTTLLYNFKTQPVSRKLNRKEFLVIFDMKETEKEKTPTHL